MFFRIVSVDANGFLGRDNHPSTSDVGQIVIALGMTAVYSDAQGTLWGIPGTGSKLWNGDASEARRAIAYAFDDAECSVLTRMWTCSTRSGRILNLVDHEVEPVTNARDIWEAR